MMMPAPETMTIAYFSMEIGLDAAMSTYSGGLGILAGDTLKTAADLGLPMIGVTLVHRRGYFRQHLDAAGNQTETDSPWQPEQFLTPLSPHVVVKLADRDVHVQAWRYLIRGESGHTVPVYFLDTSLADNNPYDRTLTDHLYGGDGRYRLCQEEVLGLGGIALLRALGYQNVRAYHMNEGHSALAILALLEEQAWGRSLSSVSESDKDAVRQRCVFTTHTPLPVGHDGFPLDLVRAVLGSERADFLVAADCCPAGRLDMTYLALTFARYINGVSMRHEEVSRGIFSNYSIESVTNGVHAFTWTSPAFRRLFDHYIPEWRRDNLYLRYAISIPLGDIRQAHAEARAALFSEIEQRTGIRLRPGAITLGLARRATAYKRTDLLFTDLDRLRRIRRQVGPIQVICGGKAHPRDEAGKALIRRVHQASAALGEDIPVVYLEEYDMAVASHLCPGVDVWLNTPQKPMEASGTSGMKAALNGVPSLSVLDGWWIEGHIEGVTGWSVGDGWRNESSPVDDAASLYDKLEYMVLPMFYERPDAFAAIMRSAIALNGSYFNTQRMLMQYQQNAYQAAGSPAAPK